MSDDLPRLTSWTRTLNEEDALALLDEARPCMALDEWGELGHRILPQTGRDRRTETIRIVRDELLDHDDGRIADSAFLRLVQDGSPHRRLGLLYGRLLYGRPLVHRTLDALVWPALDRAAEPLAPHDAAWVPRDAWDAFLRDTLHESTGPASFPKTRSTLQRVLARAGVLRLERGDQTASPHEAHAQRSRPDSLAYAWLLAHELRDRDRTEVPESWALAEAFAARLFAPPEGHDLACVEAGVAAGLLRRGYLAGQARLHPGEDR